MRIEEFGKENDEIIIMLHGANFVHSFGGQYTLAKEYHLIVPHLMGFGDHTDRITLSSLNSSKISSCAILLV